MHSILFFIFLWLIVSRLVEICVGLCVWFSLLPHYVPVALVVPVEVT